MAEAWVTNDGVNPQREEYISRINRVIDYIEMNMDDNLSLESLASVASFSRFHFHRIFRGMVGETLNQFIQRVRLEKAAAQLIASPRKSITEIALDTGFSGSSTFARAFKDSFRMSASQWRAAGRLKDSKICKTNGKKGQPIGKMWKDLEISSCYIDDITNNQIWRMKMKDKKQQVDVEVKEMPELNVAYVRHIGPYKGDSALFEGMFDKLMKWAGPRDLLRFPGTRTLCAYHDDPKITDEDKLRMSACITVPAEAEVDGEIGKMTLPGGKFAVARFEIDSDQFEESWGAIMGGWLPESGYQPDDRLCYELCHNNPNEHPEKKHIVDICVPVKPL